MMSGNNGGEVKDRKSDVEGRESMASLSLISASEDGPRKPSLWRCLCCCFFKSEEETTRKRSQGSDPWAENWSFSGENDSVIANKLLKK
jgi:hypothetical protein